MGGIGAVVDRCLWIDANAAMMGDRIGLQLSDSSRRPHAAKLH